jgi:DhnA family fructose-bisphosphate aldolase class Ia
MYGKQIRLKRLFPNDRRRLFSVPLDHSVSMGPIDGLESTEAVVRELGSAGADLVIVTKGAVREVVRALEPPMLLGVHVSASTALGPGADRKVLVGTAEEALALGADLLSVQVNFGVPEEPSMLEALGTAAEQSARLGLPLLCMAYVKKTNGGTAAELRHACRAAADLGADIVKTSYPGSLDEFRELVRTTPVPILVGGGVRVDDEEPFLEIVRQTMAAGAGGICIGRNLFQRRPLVPLARRVADILHGGASPR